MKIMIGVLLVLLASCSAREREQRTTDAFLPGKKMAELKNKNLKEISGIASSISNPKHFWVHNDAGNKAEIYLLDEDLNIKLTCELKGIKNRDWEDIAVGPGPDAGKHYVYVGDIGDNDSRYKYKYVYRFEEPVATSDDTKVEISVLDKIAFTLNGGTKDTETLLLDPRTKNLYVVSKREQPVYLYELKYPYDGESNMAQKVMSLPMTKIVGGDFSPDGREILLKNYDKVYYWSSPEPVGEKLKSPPFLVQYEKEPQGEAIAWASDGSGFYTLSEAIKGRSVYLYFYQRNNTR